MADTEAWLRAALHADMIWLESPSNPLLAVADVEAICAAPRKRGAILADAVCRDVVLIQHATSLGAVESTMERRAAIPEGHLPAALLRLSVGIEAASDLWSDLDQALRRTA